MLAFAPVGAPGLPPWALVWCPGGEEAVRHPAWRQVGPAVSRLVAVVVLPVAAVGAPGRSRWGHRLVPVVAEKELQLGFRLRRCRLAMVAAQVWGRERRREIWC